jgi:hypothetical protein
MTLSDFVAAGVARRRIGFGDVRRLERDVLPTGLTCREDAEALLALDKAIGRADTAWAAFLATAIKDFALGPGGVLDRETADWLVGGPLRERTRTGLAIARAIVLEAREVDEVLVEFVEGVRRKPRSKPLALQEAEETEAGGVGPRRGRPARLRASQPDGRAGHRATHPVRPPVMKSPAAGGSIRDDDGGSFAIA